MSFLIWYIGMIVLVIIQQITIFWLCIKLNKKLQLPLIEGSIIYDKEVKPRPYAKVKLSKRR